MFTDLIKNFEKKIIHIIFLYLTLATLISWYINSNIPIIHEARILSFTTLRLNILFPIIGILILCVAKFFLKDIYQIYVFLKKNSDTIVIFILHFSYLFFVIWGIMNSWLTYEIGYALSIISSCICIMYNDIKKKYIGIHILVHFLLLYLLSGNLWALILFAITIFTYIFRNEKTTLLFLIIFSCIGLQLYKSSWDQEVYYKHIGHDNKLVQNFIIDGNNIDKEKYINIKYELLVSDNQIPGFSDAAISEKNELLKDISNIEIEYLMPDNYTNEYILTYLFVKNRILMLIFTIMSLFMIKFMYKYCFSFGIKQSWKLFLATNIFSIKQLSYIISNFGYSIGENMDLFFMSSNYIYFIIDIFAILLIIASVIEFKYNCNITNKHDEYSINTIIFSKF